MRLIDHRRADYIPPPAMPRLRSLDPPRYELRRLAWILTACALVTGLIWLSLR